MFIVMLRQPRGAFDRRHDPFYEFGSFGITGCHGSNLMNPKETRRLIGHRLAFVQNGPKGCALICVSEPISSVNLWKRISDEKLIAEANWSKCSYFCYESAPIIVGKTKEEVDDSLLVELKSINRPTYISKFSSAFRSRATPLSGEIVNMILRKYNDGKNNAELLALSYVDAIPRFKAEVDVHRGETLQKLRETHDLMCRLPVDLFDKN